MRMYKLYMPAVTLAGALALAACGGGSSTPGTGDGDRRGTTTFTNNTTCSNGTTVTGTGPTAAAAETNAKAKCPSDPTPDPKLPEGVTAETLLGDDGEFSSVRDHSRTALTANQRADTIVYGSTSSGKFWDEILTIVLVDTDDNGRAERVASASGVTLPEGATFAGDADIDSTYNGILGTFTCGLEECARTGRTLGAGWYFTPDNAQSRWKKADSGDTYVADTDPYNEWGYWVTHDDDTSTIEWTARVPTPATAGAVTVDPIESNNKATYAGDAYGVSVMGDNSGTFTATASLTATFAAAATTLEGTISGFKGNAVNTGWELELGKITDDSPATEDDSVDRQFAGTTSGGDRLKAGDWSGALYGEGDNRPTGVIGAFEGYFTDGQAIGVYHAD